MRRELRNSVVVVTGASSGIGRAAAVRFACRGARLVLAARSEVPLLEVRQQCTALGAEALVVRTDVRDESAVQGLAASAVEHYGQIDVWLNNAGVIAYGPFEEIPSEVFRGVLETNLFGQVHGSRAVLPYFRRQGSGVLINMASVWARVTSPDVSAYVTSKYAVRAFTECLRQELSEVPGVAVVAILPQAVDTPIFHNAGNYSGRVPRPIPPLIDADEVAEGIIRCAESPRDEVTYLRLGRTLEALYSLAPRLYKRVVPPAFAAGNYSREPAAARPGNVLDPGGRHHVSGDWRVRHRRELWRALFAAGGGALRGLFTRAG